MKDLQNKISKLPKFKINSIKQSLRATPLLTDPIRWASFHSYRRKHKKLHNSNDLFYTTSPMLLEGIIKAFHFQIKKKKTGINLLDGYSYWEFGVFRGFSLWFAEMYARQYAISNFYFYGFDSFAGLPKSNIDSTNPSFGKGHYAANYEFVTSKLKELETDLDRVKLFKGFYALDFFRKLEKENNFHPISVFVNDNDIYESCAVVLEFVKKYIVPGSILLFDDYNMFLGDSAHGELRALQEFEQKYPNFKKEHIFDFGWHGKAFEVITI